jgi:hypothetical protein
MRTILFLFLVIGSSAFSQSKLTLKKKYYGQYSGEIPAYSFETEDGAIDVSACSIQIAINEDEIKFEIGQNKFQGTFKVMFEANNYFLLDCLIPNQKATERVMVFKKGKKISRDGLYPQPMSFLKKIK